MVIFRFRVLMMFLGTKKGINKAFGTKKRSSIEGLKKRSVVHGLYKLCGHPVGERLKELSNLRKTRMARLVFWSCAHPVRMKMVMNECLVNTARILAVYICCVTPCGWMIWSVSHTRHEFWPCLHPVPEVISFFLWDFVGFEEEAVFPERRKGRGRNPRRILLKTLRERKNWEEQQVARNRTNPSLKTKIIQGYIMTIILFSIYVVIDYSMGN